MDLTYIIGQNQASPASPASRESAETARAPVHGVLTRTLLRSPVIKWILPARIRRDDRNDVAFVREHSIEIKELVDDRHLRRAVLKADFGSRIRAARVLGAPRDPPPLPPAPAPVPVADSRQAILTQSYDIHDESMDVESTVEAAATPTKRLPPQILALAVQSGYYDSLVFLFCSTDASGETRFIHHNKPLPSSNEYSRRLGHQLAVDPR